MFKIYKDIVFWCIALLWLIGNIIEYISFNYCYINNLIWISIIAFVNLVKINNGKFNDWLNTPIKKEGEL